MSGSICEIGEFDPGLPDDMMNPVQYMCRTDGYQNGDIQVIKPGVTLSASIVDYVGQSDGAISVDRSVAKMAEEAVHDIAPISRQTREFQDGLRKLAIQFEYGEMPSEEPVEQRQDCSCCPAGGKRKRENQDPSERKLQKVVVSERSDSEASTREPRAIEWAQEESGIRGVASLTPGSNRLSIRDFFKPSLKTDASLKMSNLDR